MKKLLLFAGVLFFFACNTSTEQSAMDAEKVNQSPQKVSTQQTSLKVDSLPVKQQPNRSNVIYDTSRPKGQVNKVFPYDIDLKTVDGEIINSSKILKNNDKPTVLLFWLTTCGPCRMEMRAIKKVYEEWQTEADFNLVAISTDFSKNYPNFVKMVNENKWPWEAYNDVNREFRRVMPGELNGLPQTFILDKDGSIVYHKRKYRPGDEKTLFEKIKETAAK